jgi:hypothetical protein
VDGGNAARLVPRLAGALLPEGEGAAPR